jgi:hypothetical protein
MEYDFSESIKDVQIQPTEAQLATSFDNKDKIILEYIESMYEVLKKLPRGTKYKVLYGNMGKIVDGAGASSELDDLQRGMIKDYFLNLQEQKIINSVAYTYQEISPIDDFPYSNEIMIIDFDVPTLKKHFKKLTHARKVLKSRAGYYLSKGVLIWFDKTTSFGVTNRKLFGTLWHGRKIIAGSSSDRAVNFKGMLVGIDELIEVALGIKSNSTKAQREKVKGMVRDLQKRLNGFPLEIKSIGRPITHYQLISTDV